MLRAAAMVILVCGCCLAQDPAQTDPPLKVKVKLVNVAFSARDAKGALIADLTKDDVEIFEDAVPQKISFFARSTEMPLTLGLILDDSGSQGHFSKQHEHDVRVFLDNLLRPQDRVFLISFGNTIRLVSDFTNSGADIEGRMEEYRKGHRRKKRSTNSDDTEPVFPVVGPDEDRE